MRVAVVGGGPAGSSFANRLLELRRDVEVDIYEHPEGPRSFCAGGLGFYAVRDLVKYDFVYDAVSYATEHRVTNFVIELAEMGNIIDRVSLIAPELERSDLGVVMDRPRFDRRLLALAEEKGARVIRRTVNPEHLLKEYSVVVDARGLSAWGGRWGGRRGPTPEFVAQYELAGREEVMRIIFDKVIGEGYYWVFPKGETVEYGFGERAGLWPERRGEILAGLENIAGRPLHRIRRESVRTVAAVLPLYRPGCVTLGRGRVFRVGTAACLVDPLTGAGIKHAVKSGVLLAESMAKPFKSLWRAYYKIKLYEAIVPELRLSYQAKGRLLNYLRRTSNLDLLRELKEEALRIYESRGLVSLLALAKALLRMLRGR